MPTFFPNYKPVVEGPPADPGETVEDVAHNADGGVVVVVVDECESEGLGAVDEDAGADEGDVEEAQPALVELTCLQHLYIYGQINSQT